MVIAGSFPTIQCRRVYDPPADDDGKRVFVDRLWPRGMRKDALHFDLWAKNVAPSSELRRWFGHDPGRWDEFRRLYWGELTARESDVKEVVIISMQHPLTLLYAARDPCHNHALILADFLREARGEKG